MSQVSQATRSGTNLSSLIYEKEDTHFSPSIPSPPSLPLPLSLVFLQLELLETREALKEQVEYLKHETSGLYISLVFLICYFLFFVVSFVIISFLFFVFCFSFFSFSSFFCCCFCLYSILDDSLALMPEFESRIQVLKEMNYIDADRTVQLKVPPLYFFASFIYLYVFMILYFYVFIFIYFLYTYFGL